MTGAKDCSIARALSAVLIVLGIALGGISVVPPAHATPTPSLAPASSSNQTSELDLNDEGSYVASGLAYLGYYDGINTSFPVLLTGNADHQFWSENQSVLEMAPALTYIYGHDAGLMMFNGGSSTQWEISADAVTSTEFNGDGVSFYFMLTPVSNASWSSDEYVASVTTGTSISPCSGDVIFPYSTTPYFIVQWEPAYRSAWCGIGYSGDFNLFVVTPGPSGVVSAASVAAFGPFGMNSSAPPGAHDVYNVTAAYETADDELQVTAVDENSSELLADASYNLGQAGFSPPSGADGPVDLAVAEASGDRNSWGLEYVGYSTTFPALTTPVPGPSPPRVFAANFTTQLDLNGGRSYVAPGISYDGYYNGTDTSFPVLLTGSTDHQFWSENQSVLEMGPELSQPHEHDAGLMMFNGGSSTQWEISADAVTSTEFNGDGVSFYFMLTPVSNASWSSDEYVASVTTGTSISPCSGDVIFPYSTTPYFIVQWEPGYVTGTCAAGGGGDFNVFTVNPDPSGLVTASSISGAVGPIGTDSSTLPGAHDVLNVTIGFKAADNEVDARVIDQTTSQILSYMSLALVTADYLPPFESGIASHLAIAEGGTYQTGWGLLYAGATSWTELGNYTETSGFLTPPSSPASFGGGGSSGTDELATLIELGIAAVGGRRGQLGGLPAPTSSAPP